MSFRKIVLGTATMSSASVLRLLAQLLVIPVISRILSPADYGLVAIAMPFILFVMMVADAGLGRSLVRTPSDEKDVWSTCFWLSVMLGTAFALIIIAIAPVAAFIFHEPRLSPIIMALSSVIVAQALSTIPGVKLQQEHRFNVIARNEITAMVMGMVTAIAIALNGGGAWALVGQQIIYYSMRLILTFWYSPFVPRMVFNLKDIREHLIFGRDVTGASLIWVFYRSSEPLIIGKVLAETAVGLYSMAFQFARLPILLVTGPLQYVLYAQLAHSKDNKPAILTIYLLLTRLLAIVIIPVMGMIAVTHHAVFTLLLSEKWAESGALFMLAAPACALQAIAGLNTPILMVLGRTDIQLRLAMESAVVWMVLLLASVGFGLTWVVVAYNVFAFLLVPRTLAKLLPLLDCPFSAYARILSAPVFITLGCIGVFLAANHMFVVGQWGQIALAALLSLAGIGMGVLIYWHALKASVALCRNVFNA